MVGLSLFLIVHKCAPTCYFWPWELLDDKTLIFFSSLLSWIAFFSFSYHQKGTESFSLRGKYKTLLIIMQVTRIILLHRCADLVSFYLLIFQSIYILCEGCCTPFPRFWEKVAYFHGEWLASITMPDEMMNENHPVTDLPSLCCYSSSEVVHWLVLWWWMVMTCP